MSAGLKALLVGVLVLVTSSCQKTPPAPAMAELAAGLAYTNVRVANVPWSIHIARISRSHPEFALESVHAKGHVLGLATLSEMVEQIPPTEGKPVAGVNGDFYVRDRAYAGDPRGLQIVNGELLSAPIGGVSLWIDGEGAPHTTNVASQFRVTWPSGKSASLGLNEERRPSSIVLYTPSLAKTTKTTGKGFEVILTAKDPKHWLPVKVGEKFEGVVREVRDGGNSPIEPETLVLSVGAAQAVVATKPEPGAVVTISTETAPDLHGASTAISGGPILVHEGKLQDIPKPKEANGGIPYEYRSMFERHPRTAVGWNKDYYFFVEVDGRQPGLSVGMTLEELGKYFIELGCTETMNLDGGGSAMLWANGQIRNSPCDRQERAVANALLVVRKEKKAARAEESATASVK